MLKIEITEGASGRPTLHLEGRLVGPWVEELGRASAPILARGSALSLDLSAVSFVGQDGIRLLQSLRDRRVALLNCSSFVAEQLKAAELES
jgi:hypothetical protein